MRLCQFKGGGLGLVEEGGVRDISTVLRMLPNPGYPPPRGDALVRHLTELQPHLRSAARDARLLPLESVALLSPVAAPGKLVAAPLNYQDHVDETRADPATFHAAHVRRIEETGLFLKATSSLAGVSDGITLAFPERRTDHEIELAVVIGDTCRNVAPERALDFVAGYCIGLDITIRGPEERSLRKSIDTYSVLGPWMVTSDELEDPGALELRLEVDGQVRQSANTRDLIIDIPHLIAFASRWYTLEPGDVIYTGTPAGVGPLSPGNTVTAYIEGVGTMSIAVKAI